VGVEAGRICLVTNPLLPASEFYDEAEFVLMQGRQVWGIA
jgi:hypothetical protein